MMMATGPALIKSIYPADRLGRGLGLIGVATSLGLMTGPVVSGLLLHLLHWRAIFWVTVPVGLFFFVMTRRILAVSTPGCNGNTMEEDKKRTRSKGVDMIGALLWAGVVSLTLLVFTYATSLCCGNGVYASAVFVGGLVLLFFGWIFFIRHERKHAVPFLPVSLFQQRFFSMALLSSTLSFGVLFFVLILMPFYLAHILGLTPDRIGYVMMALPLSVFVVSPIAGRLHDGIGARIIATFGLFCCLVSLLLLTGLTAESSPLSIAIRLALLGFGQAMFLSPNSAAALIGVSEDQVGVTSSLLATARNFGMLAGTALASLIFAYYFAAATDGLDLKDYTPAHLDGFLFALRRTFQVGAALSLVSVIASWMRQHGHGGRR
jgi:MFS family permease